MTGSTGRIFDELLLVAARRGDRCAADRLAARWQPRLLRTARRLLRNEDEARDAVQEAWIAICRGWLAREGPARFPAWAFTVAHRECAGRIRPNQKNRAKQVFDGEVSQVPGAPEDATAIRQALGLLGPDHRLAIVLFLGEGLTLAEIADVTGVPVGTVKSRIFHARRQMRAALHGETDD